MKMLSSGSHGNDLDAWQGGFLELFLVKSLIAVV
jgi:hypothetical protein